MKKKPFFDPLTLICIGIWIAGLGYYFGFKAGAEYEMKRSQWKLRNAHMIITGGMIQDKEEK